MSADDDKDSDDLNIFLNAIGEDEEAPMRKSTNEEDIFFNLDDGEGDLHNPFQDLSDSNQPVFESPEVYVAPRVMISHQDSFSEEEGSRIEDARILPFSPRLRVPASPRAFVYQRSVESPRFGLIDTASPFESVKDAVSKFGGITDWKAHKIQTIERRKMVDEELEKMQEALPEYKRESELAEEAKHDALRELETTKGLIEELKLELEKAQLEEQQAKQDSELAQMRVEEMEKGVANEASVAVKAQLEVAKARQESATCELRSVREEIEMVCNEYEDMLREKDLAAERAEAAVKEAKEIEREMDGLSIELIATKESLESAHTAHLEAEEKRFGAAMGRDQDMYNWEKELKMVEDDIERLNQETRAADDMKTRLDAASALEYDLRAELAAFTESSTRMGNDDNIHAAVDSAKRELEEVKSNIEKAASEVKALKIIAGSLQSELARERQDLAETKERQSAAGGLVRTSDEEAREELMDTSNKFEEAMKEAEDAKLLAAAARDELRMAEELSEQAKTGMSTEDLIIRWKRMSGYNALWVPGMDHAGIATQVVVEKKLMRERGLTRHDVGREDFINEVWKWKNQHGSTILTQLRRLGASLDWSRECFTMDEQRSKAVTEGFVRLYKEGLIYRDVRLVNWDCVLKTAVSDVEVEHIDIKEKTLLKVPGYEKPVEFGLLTSFAYPLEGGLGEVVVATTRVETMLGDTAIAIHPDDARYKHLHGKFVVHPFNGRRLPIICDGILVDPNFGTGCVKITPAHDPNDCEVGKRHNLEFINIFTDDGMINTNGGSDFTGMPRFAAREAVVEALKNKGLYRGAQNNEMRLGLCQRTGDVIEPMIKPQWYVNCSMIAKEALDVAITDENKKLEFIPKQYTAEWRRWLENIRDWCISRQLWWGHRIPAWYATLLEDERKEVGAYSDHWVVARTEEEARKEAAEKFSGKKFELTQDHDVLDTWFSSGLFPLSVLGWPDETEDFKAFYPTSVLETGHDILFFWVARMVMMGMKLGGDVPFSKVYLHPMIRDAHGRKMSKSLGNVIDPLEVINGVTLDGLHKRLEEGNLDPKELVVAKEGQVKDFPNGISECGADALRFALVSYTAQSDKINLDILRVVGYRQWCNKLWNAVRFAMMRLGDDYSPPLTLSPETMPFSCQWILSVLNKAISKTVDSLNAFEFSDAANTVYAWWQYQFCDVYIEAIKPYFAGDNPAFASERAHAQHALWVSLETGLRLLHPLMPFVTEELWQRLPSPKNSERKASIMICDYPSAIENWTNEKVETEMETVLASVKCLRALRAELLEKQKNERLPAFALCENNVTSEIVKSHELEIRTLANLSSLEVLLKGEHAAPAGSAVETVNENLKVYLKVDRAINTEAEQEKIRNKIDELQKQKEKLQKMMSVSGYEEKVPANIKEDNATKLAKILQEFDFFEKESARLVAETENSGNEQQKK